MGSTRFLDPSSIPLKRQSGGSIWATLAQLTQGLTVVVFLSGLMLFFIPVIQKTQNLQREKARTQREITDAQEQQQQYLSETESMKNNPAYVEHIARDKMQLGRPGETIYRFDSYQNAPVASKSVKPVADKAATR